MEKSNQSPPSLGGRVSQCIMIDIVFIGQLKISGPFNFSMNLAARNHKNLTASFPVFLEHKKRHHTGPATPAAIHAASAANGTKNHVKILSEH